MSPSSPTDPASGREQTSRAFLVEDLERRIVEIEALDDSEIGRFTGWDWAICVVGAVVAPAFAMWWFAG
jgi:hypothetical protein